MNPFLFVVGCPRSGTTLVQRLLDAHPQLAVIDETRWIDNWFAERKGVTPEGLATRELVSNLVEFPRFARLGLGREELEALLEVGESVSYSTFVTRLFDLYGKSRGKVLVGDKTPRYVRCVPLLHEFFPAAKFVHVIRDGRSTCLSLISRQGAAKLARRFSTWNDRPVVTASLWWELHVRLGREAGKSLGPGLPRAPLRGAGRGSRARLPGALCLPRAALRRRNAPLPRGSNQKRHRPGREEGVASTHTRPPGLADGDAGGGDRAFRGGRRRAPGRARLPPRSGTSLHGRGKNRARDP